MIVENCTSLHSAIRFIEYPVKIQPEDLENNMWVSSVDEFEEANCYSDVWRLAEQFFNDPKRSISRRIRIIEVGVKE